MPKRQLWNFCHKCLCVIFVILSEGKFRIFLLCFVIGAYLIAGRRYTEVLFILINSWHSLANEADDLISDRICACGDLIDALRVLTE